MENDIQKLLNEMLVAIREIPAAIKNLEKTLVEGRTTQAGPNSLPAGGEIAVQAHRQAKNQQKMSVKEFLLQHSPVGDVQKTLAIGCYLEMHEGIVSFNKDDLEKGFRLAKELVPPNINDKVNICIRKGHMMEAEGKKDAKKAWVVTRTGEEYLKGGLKKDARTQL